jgi:FAD-linked oxidoreductase
MAQSVSSLQWNNWSGSACASPREIVQPRSLNELTELVGRLAREGRHLRVVGAGHSFTPLVYTDDVLLSLDRLQGIEKIDPDRHTVTVLGGTKLHRLSQELFAHGLAQENLGDIDVQSIAGAISTGTHGTGVRFGSLSTQVEQLTLVTASGELLTCSHDEHPDIFKAAQVSFGTLGVIATVMLRVVPAQRLHLQSRRARLSDCLRYLDQYKNEHSHFEFFWFPFTDLVQAKFLDETQEAVTGGKLNKLWGVFSRIVLENGIFWLLSEASRLRPQLAPAISKISAMSIPGVDEIDASHRLFATPRAVRFQEMEYNIPAEQLSVVVSEIQACIEKQRFAVHFPVECRFVHADDIWLSPAYQRESAYVAMHMYRGMPYQAYFEQVEEIFRRHQGRPHWGKLHTRSAEELAVLYPRWQDFLRVRAQLDPQGLFLNDYLHRLLGV